MQIEALQNFLAQQGKLLGVVLCTEVEREQLTRAGVPVSGVDTTLSMQHLILAHLNAEALNKPQLLVLTPEEQDVTAAERALIYAMLVRCRKVISCRDKLEDMLKFDDREGWQAVKAVYENKVLDVFKATWREKDAYPYNIIDNIKEYNKNESYILKQLYWHLRERTPGVINAGDMAMMRELRQMFSDISVSLLCPDVVFVSGVQDAQLFALAENFKQKGASVQQL